MGKVIPYEVLRSKIESRKPEPVPTLIELRARVRTPRPARPATDKKPARPFIDGDPWTKFPEQGSVEEARRTAQAFHPNCEYIITNFGVVVEHHRKTRATPVGKKIVMSGHVSGMKGERFENATGFRGVCETKPVTIKEQYTDKDGKVRTREIRTPDDHTIVRVKGKAKRIRRPRPGHKWNQKSKGGGGV